MSNYGTGDLFRRSKNPLNHGQYLTIAWGFPKKEHLEKAYQNTHQQIKLRRIKMSLSAQMQCAYYRMSLCDLFWLQDAAFLPQNDSFKKILQYMEKYTVQVNCTLILASCTCRLDVYDMQVRSRRFWVGAKTAGSSKSHRFPGQQKNSWPCSTLV